MDRRSGKDDRKNYRRNTSLPDPSNVASIIGGPSPREASASFRSMTMSSLPSANLVSTQRLHSATSLPLPGLHELGLKPTAAAKKSSDATKPIKLQDFMPLSQRYGYNLQQDKDQPNPLLPDPHPLGLSLLNIQISWENPILRPVPNYYPMERSNRILSLGEHSLEDITSRISSCLRSLSVQAKYFDSPAGAALLTPEHVEMYLYLWKQGNGKICIELQRRRGDSVTFHRYGRHILDSTSGDFDSDDYKDFTSPTYLKAAEKLLRMELAKINREECRSAIEIAQSLLQKDRLDARLLGMESLCILTDVRKTSLDTCMMASQAVLTGADFRDVHEFVLNIVQKRCMVDEDNLLDGMVVDYDSDDEDFWEEPRSDTKPPEYIETMNLMVNYGLTILANSWEIMATFGNEPEVTTPGGLVDEFHSRANELTHTDIFFSLLKDMGTQKVHNATLAAKALRIMGQSSPQARERLVNLGALDCATRCHKIGKVTHARLEMESQHLLDLLSA